MLALFNLLVSSDRQRRIEILRAAGERVSFFADTLRSAAMLRQCATIVFYDDYGKDFVCLLDGATDEQLVFTDIWERDTSLRELLPEKTRLPVKEKVLWALSPEAKLPGFGYRSE